MHGYCPAPVSAYHVSLSLSLVRRSNPFSAHEVHVDEEQLAFFRQKLKEAGTVADRGLMSMLLLPIALSHGIRVPLRLLRLSWQRWPRSGSIHKGNRQRLRRSSLVPHGPRRRPACRGLHACAHPGQRPQGGADGAREEPVRERLPPLLLLLLLLARLPRLQLPH